MRFSVLASSSKGNATVICGGNTRLLVDTGISATRIRKSLQECELSIKQIDAVLFTHEHTDHICGLGQLDKKERLNIYCTRYMGQELRYIAENAVYTYIEPGCPVQIGDIRITPFSINHDATDPVGYLFECNGKKLGYVTDTGKVTRGMSELLNGVDALYLESNYDPEMLRNSGRPFYLIERIASNFGHLSNEQACEFVRSIAHQGLQHLVLAHLSQDCNTPQKAFNCMQNTLRELQLPTNLFCAPAATRLPWVHIA